MNYIRDIANTNRFHGFCLMNSKQEVLLERLLTKGLGSSPSDIQDLVLRECLIGKSYQQIADSSDYDHDYIKQVGAKLWRSLSKALDKKVTKSNIRRILEQYWLENETETELGSNSGQNQSDNTKFQLIEDWGDAPGETTFLGREAELDRCKNWIVQDRCSLITILGMGGVGKTAISSKLAKSLTEEFEYIIWRSLRNAPPFLELLTDLILFVSGQQEINLPESVDVCLDCLMKYLAASRCLLVLDNMESILRSGKTGGYYREGYEGYGQLLRRIANEDHQSCLIITSREQPIGISYKEGLLVKSLPLSGLSVMEAQAILKTQEIADSQQLIEQYQGNPLALKIAATTIKSLFAGDVEEFLTQEIVVFGEIWDLLEQQFNRLSVLEQAVMYWLAINREWISLSQLRQDIVPVISARRLLEALESLRKRSLIEARISEFTQQPVVMEYMTEKIINALETEICTGKIDLLKTHPIIKAESKDYLRDAQVRLILQPIAERLLAKIGDREQVTERIESILEQLKTTTSVKAGYAAGNLLNLLQHLEVDLAGWDFSQLQVWQADLRRMSLQGVKFTNADLSRSVFTEKMGSIFAVEFSPNGKLLATGNDNLINIWQVPEYRLRMTLSGHNAPPIWSLAFSPDGSTLASGSSDRNIRLWDIATGQCLKILSGHQGSIWSLAFSLDGLTLASSSGDNTIRLWQIDKGEEIASFASKNPPSMHTLAFSSDGSFLAASDQVEGIQIWQLATKKCIHTIPIDNAGDIPLVFSPDRQILALGMTEGTIKLWNIESQTFETSLIGHTSPLTNLIFSQDGQTLASSSIDSTIRLWQFPEGICTKVLHGHKSRVSSISIASDNQSLASGSEDGSIRIWEINTGQCLRELSGYSDRVWSIAFSPDGRILASGNETSVVRLWNVETGNYQELAHGDRVKSVAFSPDGKTLATVTYNYQIRIWQLATSQCLLTIQGANSFSWSIAFSLDSKNVVTCGGDGLVYCWDVATGNPTNILKGHQSTTAQAVFLSGIYDLASTSLDKTVKLWNLKTGKCLKTLNQEGGVWSIAYHLDSNIIVAGIENGSLNLWNLNTGDCFGTLTGHTQIVLSLAFNADGSLIVSSGNDRTIRIWDVATKECIQTIDDHQDSVFEVAFSPQDNIIASGSHDETVKLWDLNTGECLQVFKAPSLYEGMNISGATGLSEAQKSTLKALGSVD